MNRFITDPENYTFADLQNYDWDVIQTNITVNVDKMMEWANEVKAKFGYCGFNPLEHMHLAKKTFQDTKEQLIEEGFGIWNVANFRQWTLQWGKQRDSVIPFKQIMDPEQFPEINDPDFASKFNTNLNQYYFGGYKEYYDTLGSDILSVTRLVQFGPGMGLKPHTDNGPDEKFYVRMHLQLQIDNTKWWKFGKNMERKYTFEPGRVYLYNTSNHHAARNEGENDWIMLHNDPIASAVDKILKTSMHIG
jgi:hypothetical protein